METDIFELLNRPDENRDQDWEFLFLDAFPNTQLKLISDQPEVGPDGMPYLLAEISSNGEPTKKVLQWLSERGIGLVIHPEKQNPDYIFTYGMIWYAIQTGKFLEPTIESRELGAVAYDKSEDFVIGEPTTEFLPESARSNLKKFLLDQGVYNPRICVLSGDGKNFDFGVFVESLGNPPEKEYLGISQALSWFLPQHYSISLISDADFRVSFPL